MGDPSRRQNQRFPCNVAATIHTPSSGAEVGPARLTDLAIEGAAVETAVPLVRRIPYELRWDWKGLEFRVVARVAWDKPARSNEAHRFGLAFTTTSEQETVLRQMIDALRQQLWSSRGPR